MTPSATVFICGFCATLSLHGTDIKRRAGRHYRGDDQQRRNFVRDKLGEAFISDLFEQLVRCIELVFASSRSQRVREYLKELSIEVIYGTAVTIQQMVFGNKNYVAERRAVHPQPDQRP
ncbi:hypothetical protein MASR1M12_37460 [Erysipelotrichia bacterium]